MNCCTIVAGVFSAFLGGGVGDLEKAIADSN